VRFDLSDVLTLCLFDGCSEGIVGFLISVWVSVLLLASGSSSFSLASLCLRSKCDQEFFFASSCIGDMLVEIR
jgi:hypothetical protein